MEKIIIQRATLKRFLIFFSILFFIALFYTASVTLIYKAFLSYKEEQHKKIAEIQKQDATDLEDCAPTEDNTELESETPLNFSDKQDETYTNSILSLYDNRNDKFLIDLSSKSAYNSTEITELLISTIRYNDYIIYANKQGLFAYDTKGNITKTIISSEQFRSENTLGQSVEPNMDFIIYDDKLYVYQKFFNIPRDDADSFSYKILTFDLSNDSFEKSYLEINNITINHFNEIYSYETDILLQESKNKLYAIFRISVHGVGYYYSTSETSTQTYQINEKPLLISSYISPDEGSVRLSNGKDLKTYSTTDTLGIRGDYEYLVDFSYYCSSSCRYNEEEGFYSKVFLALKRKSLSSGKVEIIKKWNPDDYIYLVELREEIICYEEREKYILISLDGSFITAVTKKQDECDLEWNYTYGRYDYSSKYFFSCWTEKEENYYYDYENKKMILNEYNNGNEIYFKEDLEKANKRLDLTGDQVLKITFWKTNI